MVTKEEASAESLLPRCERRSGDSELPRLESAAEEGSTGRRKPGLSGEPAVVGVADAAGTAARSASRAATTAAAAAEAARKSTALTVASSR